MPELPEVETVKNGLKKRILNKEIENAFIYAHNIVDYDNKLFIKTLKNKKIKDIERIGKFLIFKLSDDVVLLSHLRMEGKFIPANNIKEKSRFARVIFLFKDKTILNYDDSRMFGYMSLKNYKNYKTTPPISLLGEEAINNIDVDDFYKKISKLNKPIKEVILDQHIISGIGNIYADETLFKSKINPLTKANCLSKKEVSLILKSAKEILLLAIKHNGSTVHSFTWDKGKSGDMQRFLKVYGKEGKDCPCCHHAFIKIKVGGRGTTYCPYCQKLNNEKYVLGITGPVSSGKSTALNIFKKNKYSIFSCDNEVSKLYENDDFKKRLKTIFKTSSKKEIKLLVLKNRIRLNELEKIIHPIIKDKIIQFIKNNKGNIAIEVPLLFQSKFDNLMDETLLILSEKNTKFISNRGETGKAQLKINNSLDYTKYKKSATYVINNNSTLNNFKKEIEKISR